MKPIDSNGNTIAHIAAEGNHVSVFKVSFLTLNVKLVSILNVFQTTFPKTKTSENLFEILTVPNSHDKTPLHLAIENGNVGSVLNS